MAIQHLPTSRISGGVGVYASSSCCRVSIWMISDRVRFLQRYESVDAEHESKHAGRDNPHELEIHLAD